MGIMWSLQGLDNFLLYFLVAIVAEVVFLLLYTAVTPHHEMTLIRQGNVAAAISLAGAVVGFTLPLASVIIHAASLVDLAIWAAIALVVQLAVYWLIELALRGLSARIEKNDIAAAITLAAASLALGVINAASLTY